MSLAPIWKIKRELLRMWYRVEDLYLPLLEWFYQIYYDFGFNKITLIIDGQEPLSKKVAIFLIYQPGVMSKSIIVTCNFLQDQGYSILLVSSTPVNEGDLHSLQKVT